jgi:hypothetical protein
MLLTFLFFGKNAKSPKLRSSFYIYIYIYIYLYIYISLQNVNSPAENGSKSPSSAAFLSFTEPPYWIRTESLTSWHEIPHPITWWTRWGFKKWWIRICLLCIYIYVCVTYMMCFIYILFHVYIYIRLYIYILLCVYIYITMFIYIHAL